jgi:hypothetical protein
VAYGISIVGQALRAEERICRAEATKGQELKPIRIRRTIISYAGDSTPPPVAERGNRLTLQGFHGHLVWGVLQGPVLG